MSEVLDEFEIDNKPKKKGYFNLISFLNGLCSLILLLYWTNSTFSFNPAKDSISSHVVSALIFLTLLFAGGVFTFLSFKREGKFAMLKWIGAAVNISLILITISFIFYLYVTA